MNWRSEWLPLHDRIAGIERAFETCVRGLGVQSEDPYSVRRKVFRPEFLAVLDTIRSFRQAHAGSLPKSALSALDRFLATHSALVGNTALDNIAHLTACVTALSAFRTELGFQLTNRSVGILRVTERALQHLQRLIVADLSVARKWREAFEKGELVCEQLGAAHLLLHGIWAFKVSGAGERTDLVYNEPVADLEIVARAADALVLTEWKAVRSSTELTRKIEAAMRQADRYAKGALGGVELTDSRFIIVVSNDTLSLPDDVDRNGVAYRVRGIAVSPSPPSKAST